MSLSIPGISHSTEELESLRRLISELAEQCQLDLSNKSALRHFLDGAPTAAPPAEAQTTQELRAMLILLFRLEASSSEDLGYAGLRQLWHQHSETLARHRLSAAIPTGQRQGIAGR